MIRAAIVGAGYVGRVHAHALRELGVELAAVCGRTGEGAEAMAAETGGAPYDDLEDLLAAQRPDVLHVCTPNALHAPQTLLALERGINVVCEKPLATSADESALMVEAADGLVAATMYHVRGYPLVRQMRAEAPSLGPIRAVHGRYSNDDGLGGLERWNLDPSRSGPTYVTGDLGSHWLDLAEHVSGLRIAEVFAEFRSFVRGPLEDHATLLLRFESGATGSATFSAVVPGRKNQLLLECEGEDGGLTWDQERPDELLLRPADGPPRLVPKDPLVDAQRPYARYPAGHAEGYGDAFRNVLREVYRAVAGEPHEPFPTFADGHRGMQIVDAALASARTGAWKGC
jgi:predicted dehydrogenase